MVRSTLMEAALVAALLLVPLLHTETIHAQDTDTHPPGTVVRVTLVDGNIHVGTVESHGESELIITTSGGVRMTIPTDRIRRIEVQDRARFAARDPNRTRLFFSPTARPVPHGSGYVALYELFFPFVAVGLKDVLTLAGGVSLVPGTREQILYVAPKASLYSSGNTGFALGGLLGSNTGFDSSAGLIFGIGTFGSPEAAVTVGAGFGFVEGEFSSRPVLLVAGEYQVSNSVKLLTENYVIPGYGDAILSVAGIRFFGRQLAADVGLMTAPTLLDDAEGFPFVPWLGFAYNFRAD